MKNEARQATRRRLLLAGLACYGIGSVGRALAADAAGDMQDHHGHMAGMNDAGQHQHHHAPVPEGLKRSEAMYTIPALTLVRQDGAKVAFPQELDSGGPVVLDFIYTSCTTVCPVTSQVLSEFQEQLGKDSAKLRIISLSIDPEYDTPARLREYAKKFHAGQQWQHYTGTQEASIAMQKAFDAYRGDKMNHFPVTFLRAAPGKPWIRIEGFATPDVLVREFRGMTKMG